MTTDNQEFNPYKNLPKPPHPPIGQPEFPIQFPYTFTNPSPINYHRFDNVPRPLPWHDTLLSYFNSEYFQYLNDLHIPHYSQRRIMNLPTHISISLHHKDDPAAPWEFVSNSLPPTSQVIEEHNILLGLK